MPEVEPVFEIHDHNWGLYAWMVKKDPSDILMQIHAPRRKTLTTP